MTRWWNGAAPDGAAVLGEVYSPPMVRLVDIMLTDSDNVIAEALARQVALAAANRRRSKARPRPWPRSWSSGLATPEQQPELADGSGLSRDNQISARLLTDLLILAAGPGPAELSGLFAGLPVAGWSGTLLDRHDRPPPELALAEGVVRAKTGSLFAVDALAGVVETAGGRWLAFAVIANDVSVDHDTAREALDRIPAALAGPVTAGQDRDRRPAAPQIASPRRGRTRVGGGGRAGTVDKWRSSWTGNWQRRRRETAQRGAAGDL